MRRVETSEPAYRPPMSQWQTDRARGTLHPMETPEPVWRSFVAAACVPVFLFAAVAVWSIFV